MTPRPTLVSKEQTVYPHSRSSRYIQATGRPPQVTRLSSAILAGSPRVRPRLPTSSPPLISDVTNFALPEDYEPNSLPLPPTSLMFQVECHRTDGHCQDTILTVSSSGGLSPQEGRTVSGEPNLTIPSKRTLTECPKQFAPYLSTFVNRPQNPAT